MRLATRLNNRGVIQQEEVEEELVDEPRQAGCSQRLVVEVEEEEGGGEGVQPLPVHQGGVRHQPRLKFQSYTITIRHYDIA